MRKGADLMNGIARIPVSDGGQVQRLGTVLDQRTVFADKHDIVFDGREQFFEIGILSSARGGEQHAERFELPDERENFFGQSFLAVQKRSVQIARNKFYHRCVLVVRRPP